MATDPVHTNVRRPGHTFTTFTHSDTSTVSRKFVCDCVRMHDVTYKARPQRACQYWIAVILAVLNMFPLL